MGRIYESHWRPFLTRPVNELRMLVDKEEAKSWRPVPWLLRATLPRLLILLVAMAIMTLLCVIFLLRVREIVMWLVR